MNDEITVKVHSYGPKRPLALVYIDPVSRKKKAKSAGTYDEGKAEGPETHERPADHRGGIRADAGRGAQGAKP